MQFFMVIKRSTARRVEPGRDRRPVMNQDLYPTLLELAGLAGSQGEDGARLHDLWGDLLDAPDTTELHAASVGVAGVVRSRGDYDRAIDLAASVGEWDDVLTTIGLFAITQLEFNLATVAAILTIAGYSINDTVVIYDRVREELRRYKKLDMPALLNLAANRTLSRTFMTSVTTLIALVALAIFGGTIIRDFALAMIWGVIIGTYSSVFIASPVLQVMGVKREWDKKE